MVDPGSGPRNFGALVSALIVTLGLNYVDTNLGPRAFEPGPGPSASPWAFYPFNSFFLLFQTHDDNAAKNGDNVQR